MDVERDRKFRAADSRVSVLVEWIGLRLAESTIPARLIRAPAGAPDASPRCMTLLGFLILLAVAGIAGALGQAIAGYTRTGCIGSIALGFVGALLGAWL